MDQPTAAHARVSRFPVHPLRATVLAEAHARPFHAMPTPVRLLHLAFLAGEGGLAAGWEALRSFCAERGIAEPPQGARHHRAAFGDGCLRWESHSEFSTFTFEFAAPGGAPFEPERAALAAAFDGLAPPGALLVAVDLHVLAESAERDPLGVFDPASLAVAKVEEGRALAASDFRLTTDGYTRILVVDGGLAPERTGAIAIRLLEIETYRTLSLLGLPLAQRLNPRVRALEVDLSEITEAIRTNDGPAENAPLLDRLTALAAELEAESAAHSYRFGATRAYDGIVAQRLVAIRELPARGHDGWASFLARRHGPAMRTCALVEARLADLSVKVARAASLLRTRVDIDLARQNRDLLRSMDERTRMQLRLQRTVEGLSVAAVSYYVIGLILYLAKGVEKTGVLPVAPELVAAAALPVVVLLVAGVIRRIRRSHEA